MIGPRLPMVKKLNYENLQLQCRACYEKAHLTKSFPKASHKLFHRCPRPTIWWEGANVDHYMVYKKGRPVEGSNTDDPTMYEEQQGSRNPPRTTSTYDPNKVVGE